jgi:hypothetical protein
VVSVASIFQFKKKNSLTPYFFVPENILYQPTFQKLDKISKDSQENFYPKSNIQHFFKNIFIFKSLSSQHNKPVNLLCKVIDRLHIYVVWTRGWKAVGMPSLWQALSTDRTDRGSANTRFSRILEHEKVLWTWLYI